MSTNNVTPAASQHNNDVGLPPDMKALTAALMERMRTEMATLFEQMAHTNRPRATVRDELEAERNTLQARSCQALMRPTVSTSTQQAEQWR